LNSSLTHLALRRAALRRVKKAGKSTSKLKHFKENQQIIK